MQWCDSLVLLNPVSLPGTQNSLDYVRSLRTFVSDCSDSMIEMIENLIDNKTGGKHSQVKLAYFDAVRTCVCL